MLSWALPSLSLPSYFLLLLRDFFSVFSQKARIQLPHFVNYFCDITLCWNKQKKDRRGCGSNGILWFRVKKSHCHILVPVARAMNCLETRMQLKKKKTDMGFSTSWALESPILLLKLGGEGCSCVLPSGKDSRKETNGNLLPVSCYIAF